MSSKFLDLGYFFDFEGKPPKGAWSLGIGTGRVGFYPTKTTPVVTICTVTSQKTNPEPPLGHAGSFTIFSFIIKRAVVIKLTQSIQS